MQLAEFEGIVELALAELPEHLRAAISNLTIAVEERNREDPDLYGLYLGIPLTERGSGYAGALPDTIAIYRRPLVEDFGDDPAELAHEIRVTVLHELAHHFGIDDSRLGELGFG